MVKKSDQEIEDFINQYAFGIHEYWQLMKDDHQDKWKLFNWEPLHLFMEANQISNFSMVTLLDDKVIYTKHKFDNK